MSFLPLWLSFIPKIRMYLGCTCMLKCTCILMHAIVNENALCFFWIVHYIMMYIEMHFILCVGFVYLLNLCISISFM